MVVVIVAYTDGSANNSIKKVGGVGVYFNELMKISTKYLVNNCTNQRMELQACVDAIKNAVRMMKGKNRLWRLDIYTDSMYAINTATKFAAKWIQYGWHRMENGKSAEIKNLDQVKELYKLYKMYNVTFTHVRSHEKEPSNKNSAEWKHWYGNKSADELAKHAAKS